VVIRCCAHKGSFNADNFNFNTMISSYNYCLRAFDVASNQEEKPLPAEGDKCNVKLKNN
jgi:hypothetical protein